MKRLFCVLLALIACTLLVQTSYADTDANADETKFHHFFQAERGHSDWNTHLNDNFDTMDRRTPIVRDFANRPDTPPADQILIDTGSAKVYIYDTAASSWQPITNADTLAGNNLGNDTGDIPLNNGAVHTGLYSDTAVDADTASFADDSDLLDGINSTLFLRSDEEDTKTGKTNFQDTVDIDAHLGAVGSTYCASDEFIDGDGNCNTDNTGAGADLEVEDDQSSVVNAADTVNARRNITANKDSTNRADLDAYMEDYITPDGMVIDTGGASDSVSLAVGGAVYADWVGSGETTPQVVEIDAGDTLDFNQTGCNGLVAGSSLNSDQWYEAGWAVDKDGTKNPCMIAWTHTSSTDSTPTKVSHLPSDYELFREMGIPGKTWWVRTDGSSNILGFNHSSNGIMQWTTSALSIFGSDLFASSSPNTNETVDVSGQVPPVSVQLKVNRIRLQTNSNGANTTGFHNESMSSAENGLIQVGLGASSDASDSGKLDYIDNQEVHIRTGSPSNVSDLRFRKISSFKVVE